MCGRFDFDLNENRELQAIMKRVKIFSDASLEAGEIFPTQRVPVLVGELKNRSPLPMYWGFPHFKGSGVIINARSETVTEKAMFRDSILSRRCIVASSGFFEWDQYRVVGGEKAKYKFNLLNDPTVYMAGIYSLFPEEGRQVYRFILLTTEANRWMEDIHGRMPVVLRPSEVKQWFHGPDYTSLFDRRDVELVREQVGFPSQMTLF